MSDQMTPETSQQSIRPESAAIAGVELVVPAAFASRLERQRDELLEALESFPGFTDDASIGDPWIEKKQAAIASVREGKP